MKCHIDRTLFLKSLGRVQGIIEKRSNMPILSMILLEANGSSLQVSATDLEIAFRQSLEAQIDQEGAVAAPGRKLFEILRESTGSTIQIFQKENNWIYLSDGTAEFNLAGLPAEEFPGMVEPEEVSFFEVDASLISEMITKTIYAVTMEEAGFKLSGIYTEKIAEAGKEMLRMVGTDGHRLSLVDKEIPGLQNLQLPGGVVIPKKGMTEINRLASEGGTIHIGFKQSNCIAKKDTAIIMIRLLETKFPDYHAVIPKRPRCKITVNRALLLQAMKKMLILSNERYKAVKITLGENVMDLHSTNPDLGEAEEKISVDYQEEPLELAFNARYFIDVLQNMESEEIELSFVDDSKPCVIRGDLDQGFMGLIMPMRI
ncbi:MAG: DNA polymerase III subunit beta [Deltaproteobacteria bacterium]|nr:DNA polymerase III subunit beta [Deltaproteobacteria bacterium]MBW1927572.1 DNA polymerase III subunit beta [Deltaproteobacteria bacterium]MBW2024638.1 DNA polymerase III subunit beta [Deltaproteobacteria bacterium]MBW2124795.1 DNA polymerase III subunit beta [Deltaproteobacteria bacterium]RLB16416.1 MAG: DNA polymerase III subunit beta [Deltaproteobacteria bacterium]